MKIKLLLIIVQVAILSVACTSKPAAEEEIVTIDPEKQMEVYSPTPSVELKEVTLTDNQTLISSALGHFSFKVMETLYGQTEQPKEWSVLFSPLSAQYALGMLSNGLGEASKADLISQMASGVSQGQLNDYFKVLSEQLPAVNGKTTLSISNVAVINDKYMARNDFRNILADYYYAPALSISFEDTDYIKKLVNGWCQKNTNGLVTEMIDDVSPLAIAYLIDCLYIRDSWAEPFNEKLTVKQPFYANGTSVAMDFMSKGESLEYFACDYCRVARKDLSNGRYAVYLIKPYNVSITSLLGKLGTDWAGLRSSLKSNPLRLHIPKFTAASSFDLIKTLRAMGINTIFANPDFSPMLVNPSDASITKILQKSKLSLDEGGLEGGSATLIAIEDSGLPNQETIKWIDMTLDHPFVYVVEEKSSGVLLFIGVMAGD